MPGFGLSPACVLSALSRRRVRDRGCDRRNSAKALGPRKTNPTTHAAKARIFSITDVILESLTADYSIIRAARRLGTSLGKARTLLPPKMIRAKKRKKDYRDFTSLLLSTIESEWLLDYYHTDVCLCKNCTLCRLADCCKPGVRKPRGMAREPQASAELPVPGRSDANC